MGIIFNAEMIISTVISIMVYAMTIWILNKYEYGSKWACYVIAILVSSVVPYLITPLLL